MVVPAPGLDVDQTYALDTTNATLNADAARRQTGEYAWVDELERQRLGEQQQTELRLADIEGARRLEEINALNTQDLETRSREMLETARREAETAAERANVERLQANGATPDEIAIFERAEAEAKRAAETARAAEEALTKAREEYDEKKTKLYDDIQPTKAPQVADGEDARSWQEDEIRRFNGLKETLRDNPPGSSEYVAARQEIREFMTDEAITQMETQRVQLDAQMRAASFTAMDSARSTHNAARTSEHRTNLANAKVHHNEAEVKTETTQVIVSERMSAAAARTPTQTQANNAHQYQENARNATEARATLDERSVNGFVAKIKPKIDKMYEDRLNAMRQDPATTDQDIARVERERDKLLANLQDKSQKIGGQFQEAYNAIESSQRTEPEKDALRAKLLQEAVRANTDGRMTDTFAAEFLTRNVPEKAPVNLEQLATAAGVNPSDITIVELIRDDRGQDKIMIRSRGDEGGRMREITDPAIVNQMRDNGINVNGGSKSMIVLLDAETGVAQDGKTFAVHGSRGHDITMMHTGSHAGRPEDVRAMSTMMSNVRSGGDSDPHLAANANARAGRLELAAQEREADRQIAQARAEIKVAAKLAEADRLRAFAQAVRDGDPAALAALQQQKDQHAQRHGHGGTGTAAGANPHHGGFAMGGPAHQQGTNHGNHGHGAHGGQGPANPGRRGFSI